MEKDTKCVYRKNYYGDKTGALTMPIYQTATFVHSPDGINDYCYSRQQNPTREYLENVVADLEEGKGAVACSSGMAAIALVFKLFAPPAHFIVSEDIYGGTYRFFEQEKKSGFVFSYVDTSNEQAIEKSFTPDTKAIYIETPTNPMMNVTDIKKAAVSAKKHNALLVCDNTFLTPYFQQPLKLGADIVLHSGTKYLSGHNDTLAGFAVTADDNILENLRFISKTVGMCLSPIDCFLVERGIKTLSVRLEKQSDTAEKTAEWLSRQDEIKNVFYNGLSDNPYYTLSKKQSSGFGAMLSFETHSAEKTREILKKVKLIKYAESLGGTESLITYPLLQTHADIPENIRSRLGITDRLLRLSVGLENSADIIKDLEQAIKNV